MQGTLHAGDCTLHKKQIATNIQGLMNDIESPVRASPTIMVQVVSVQTGFGRTYIAAEPVC